MQLIEVKRNVFVYKYRNDREIYSSLFSKHEINYEDIEQIRGTPLILPEATPTTNQIQDAPILEEVPPPTGLEVVAESDGEADQNNGDDFDFGEEDIEMDTDEDEEGSEKDLENEGVELEEDHEELSEGFEQNDDISDESELESERKRRKCK